MFRKFYTKKISIHLYTQEKNIFFIKENIFFTAKINVSINRTLCSLIFFSKDKILFFILRIIFYSYSQKQIEHISSRISRWIRIHFFQCWKYKAQNDLSYHEGLALYSMMNKHQEILDLKLLIKYMYKIRL